MWPFSKKPAPKAPFRDYRIWNEDWKVGDTAECVTDNWHDCIPPWHRPAIGARFTVVGFSEGANDIARVRAYFLKLEGWPFELSCTAFRKVRPVAVEQSEVVSAILNAKPGADRVREEASANPLFERRDDTRGENPDGLGS